MSLSKLQELVMDRGAWHAVVHAKSRKLKNNFISMVHFTDCNSNVPHRLRVVGYLHRHHWTLRFLWEEALSHSVLYYQNLALCLQLIQGLKK